VTFVRFALKVVMEGDGTLTILDLRKFQVTQCQVRER